MLEGLFNTQYPSETDALMDHWRQQQAGMGTTLKYLYEKIDALEKRITELERNKPIINHPGGMHD